jgi:hypothetical protein
VDEGLLQDRAFKRRGKNFDFGGGSESQTRSDGKGVGIGCTHERRVCFGGEKTWWKGGSSCDNGETPENRC